MFWNLDFSDSTSVAKEIYVLNETRAALSFSFFENPIVLKPLLFVQLVSFLPCQWTYLGSIRVGHEL
jgi:hypothetical protein